MSGRVALSRQHRWSLYCATAIVWISGMAWLWLKYVAAPIQTELGPVGHPAQALWIRIHGAAAMATLLAVGALLPYHVPLGWKQRRSRKSGTTMLAVAALLVLTGWGLYYLGDDRLRASTSVIHSIVGAAAPLALFVHLWARSRRRRATHDRGD